MVEQRSIDPLACHHPAFYTADMFNQPRKWSRLCPLCRIARLRDALLKINACSSEDLDQYYEEVSVIARQALGDPE